MNTETLEPSAWRERCARRVSEIEPGLLPLEARRLAQDLYAFERTRVMVPEEAADFVASEMGRPDRARFERRGRERLAEQGSAVVPPDRQGA